MSENEQASRTKAMNAKFHVKLKNFISQEEKDLLAQYLDYAHIKLI